MKGQILFLGLISLLIITNMVSVSAYEINYYQSDPGSNTDIRHGFYFDDYNNCNITTYIYHDNSTAKYETRLYDPYSNFMYYVTRSAETGNSIFSASNKWIADNNTYELKITQDYVSNSYIKYEIKCPETKKYLYINASETDSDDYLLNAFCYDYTSPINLTDSNFNISGSLFKRCIKTGLVSGNRNYAIPFIAGYNSTELYVRITSDFGNSFEDFSIYVYPINNSSNMAYGFCDYDNGYPDFSHNITLNNLEPNKEYVFMFSYNKGTQTYPKTLKQMYVKTLDLTANISCNDWSICNEITNTKSKYCYDVNNLIEPYYEYKTCSVLPTDYDENASIGFNTLEEYSVPICVPNWTISGCTQFVINKTIYLPENWDFTDNSGTNTLEQYRYNSYNNGLSTIVKLWSSVPKQNEAFYNYSGTDLWECVDDVRIGSTLTSHNLSNDTMSLSYNISFPADNMAIEFYARKCADQVTQYSIENSSSWLGFNCGEQCYSSSCDDPVNGGYRFVIENVSNLYDADPLTVPSTLFSDIGDLSDTWRYFGYELEGDDYIAGQPFRLSLSTYDPIFSNVGTCIEIKSVTYGISSSEFECVDYCDNSSFHYIQAHLLNNLCIYEDQGYSTECVSEKEYIDYYNSCTSFCDSSLDYHIGDNTSGVCEWSAIEDSPLCIDEGSIYDSLADDYLDETQPIQKLIINFTSIFGLIILLLVILLFNFNLGNPVIILVGMAILIMALVNFEYLPAIYLWIIVGGIAIAITRGVVNLMTSNTAGGV